MCVCVWGGGGFSPYGTILTAVATDNYHTGCVCSQLVFLCVCVCACEFVPSLPVAPLSV